MSSTATYRVASAHKYFGNPALAFYNARIRSAIILIYHSAPACWGVSWKFNLSQSDLRYATNLFPWYSPPRTKFNPGFTFFVCNINKSFIFLQQVEVSMSCLVDKHDVVNLGSTGNFPHKSECTSPPKSLALFRSRTLGYSSSRSWHRYMIFKKKRWLARRYAFEMNSSGELVFDELFRGLEGDMTHTSMQLIRCRYILCYASCSSLFVNSIYLSW